jgi:UDP-glucose 4-epimerase
MSGDVTLVTGGAGFVGSALCRALVGLGHEVVVHDDLSVGRPESLPAAGCRLVRGDNRDPDAVEGLLRETRPRRVIHLAALHYIPHCNADPVKTVEINVNGTRSLLAACRRTPPEWLFVASTAAVYPPEGSPFQEETRVGPIDIYGHTKAAAEELARLFHRETGVRTVVGRLFNVFGPNDSNPHLIPEVVKQAKNGGGPLELGNLDPIRDYIHVDDVVSGILASERLPEPLAVVNIGTGQGQSVRQVVEAVESALGRPLQVVQTQGRVRRVERQQLVADVGRLRSHTGWRPEVTFGQGIAALLADNGNGAARTGRRATTPASR